MPSVSRRLSSISHCVDFPALSRPSIAIRAPRLGIVEYLGRFDEWMDGWMSIEDIELCERKREKREEEEETDTWTNTKQLICK